jgi:hypothetical protein
MTDITDIEVISSELLPPVDDDKGLIKGIVKEDFDYARQNIKTIIDTGMEAVTNLAVIARQSEHPRIYECLSNLLQINTMNNKILLELSQSLDKESNPSSGDDAKTINNTLVVTTTTDIQRIVEDKLKKLNGKTT